LQRRAADKSFCGNENKALASIQTGKTRIRMRYIVTGGAGFFGSLLVETLLEHGHEVMVVDRLFDAQVAARTRFSQTDLRDADALDRELKAFGPIDGVFHIAAMLAHAKNDLPML
jgi:nucleoside-diphosphate-sugar epimerase